MRAAVVARGNLALKWPAALAAAVSLPVHLVKRAVPGRPTVAVAVGLATGVAAPTSRRALAAVVLSLFVIPRRDRRSSTAGEHC
jgi:hypothetical protein